MQAFRRFWSHPNLLKDSRGGRLFWLVDAFLIARGYFGTTPTMPVSCAYISMQQLAALRGRGVFSRSQIFRVHSPTLGGPQHSNTVLDVFVASRTSKSIHLVFFAPATAADGISVHFPRKMAEANVNQQPEPVCIRQAQVVVDICFSCPQLHFRCVFQGNWPRHMSTSNIRSKN